MMKLKRDCDNLTLQVTKQEIELKLVLEKYKDYDNLTSAIRELETEVTFYKEYVMKVMPPNIINRL